MLSDLLIGGVIAALFIAPALLHPTLGRIVLSTMFVCGGLFNLLYTLPKAPDSLVALVATAPIPPYREVVAIAIAWNAAPMVALLAATFELTAGLLILWRGPLVRLALLAAGAWGLGMLPVIPPYGLPIGVALTGAPGVAGLLLARRGYSQTVIALAAPSIRPMSSLLRAIVHPVSALLIFGALWGLFVGVLHPWFMNWGTTSEERSMVLPGDTDIPAHYLSFSISLGK